MEGLWMGMYKSVVIKSFISLSYLMIVEDDGKNYVFYLIIVLEWVE